MFRKLAEVATARETAVVAAAGEEEAAADESAAAVADEAVAMEGY